MEGTKNKITGLVVLLLFPVIFSMAQTKDLAYYQCAFYESYRQGNMDPWPGLISEMQKQNPTDLVWQTEIIKAMYGLTGYELGKQDKDLARKYIDLSDKYFDKLLKTYSGNAQLHSLAGAFYGYKIALAFYKAPFLGPKSMYHINKSIELDASEPMGYIERGNSLMYRPVAFGGNKQQGLLDYRKALRLMETRDKNSCNWQKLLLRAFILKALYETDQDAEARAFLAEMQKDYGSMEWVKKFVGAEFMEGK